ncbi:hypothetical protein BM1_04199 [Bipolaris maydis]|nr:hypothetical protein BM1_04199 [Bipolaris maydis]
MRLSKRVLHFCAQEVIWVCRTCQQSESGENDRDLVNPPVGMKNDHHVSYASLEANPTRLWHRMIAEYSRLQLSFKRDKMAALAGLAQRMARLRSDDRYLTGSWEGSLLLDLLWERSLEATLDTQKLDCYPSWSWPSFDGQVHWSQDHHRSLESVCIEDISYTSCAQDFMCKSAPITLTLRAPLLDAQTFFAHSQDYDDGLSQTITNLDHLYVSYAVDDIETRDSDPDQSGFIIPISAESQESGFFRAIRVRQKPNSNCFERIGSVTLDHPAGRLCNSFGQKLENQERRKTHLLSVRKLLESLPTSKIVLV